MIIILSKLNSYSFKGRQNVLKSGIRFAVKFISNFILPFYFKIRPSKKLKSYNDRTPRIICSLTTFPARINKVWLTIESLLRQDLKPDKIILWLSKEQFKNEEELPHSILKLKAKGVDIILCEGDLRSHKKYFYSMKKYKNDIIITFDDDVFYDPRTLRELYMYYLKDPKTIWTNRGWRIKFDNRGNVLPYKDWQLLSGYVKPSFDILQTGVGGVLYPPHALHDFFLKEEIFMKYCKFADDVWLHFMSNINGTKIGKTSADFLVIPIIYKNNQTLNSINVGEDLNSTQFRDMLIFLKQSSLKYNKQLNNW